MTVTRYYDASKAGPECTWYEGEIDDTVAVEGMFLPGDDFRGTTAIWRNEDGEVLSDEVRYARLAFPSTGEVLVERSRQR